MSTFRTRVPPPPLTGGTIDVRQLRPWLNEMRETVAQIVVAIGGMTQRIPAGRPFDVRSVVTVTVGGGRRWAAAEWTGTPSDYLRIPYDGATAPSYVSQATYEAYDWTTMPADDGSDDRANALYVQLSQTSGPDLPVSRA